MSLHQHFTFADKMMKMNSSITAKEMQLAIVEFVKEQWQDDGVEVDAGFKRVCKRQCGLDACPCECGKGRMRVGRKCEMYAEAVLYGFSR